MTAGREKVVVIGGGIGGLAAALALLKRGLDVEDCDNCRDDDGNQLIDRDDPACTPPTDAGGAGLGDATRGKALGKCAQALAKAGAKLVAGETKRLHKCLQTAFQCVQEKPGDAKCRTKAVTACSKQFAKLTAPVKGVAAKLTTAITKPCTKAPLVLTDVLGTDGLGFAALGGECAALGAPSAIRMPSS